MIKIAKLACASRFHLVLGAAFFSVAWLGGNDAHATGSFPAQTCASLDASQGGSALNPTGSEQFNIALVDGDVLQFGSGQIEYEPPGMVRVSTTGPLTINVTSSNAGTFIVFRQTVASVSCSRSMSTSSTESENLDAQQDALSSLLMLHHANTMSIGVQENVNGAVGGGTDAAQNYVSRNGFFYSTRNAARARDQRFGMVTAYVDGEGDGLGYMGTRWNAWIKGRYTYYDGDGGAFDGGIADIFGGADYRVSDMVVVGALAGYGRTDFDTVTAGTPGGFEADGFTIGGYTGIAFGNGVVLDAMAAYTGSDYNNRSGATTGSFNADRFTFAAHLRGEYDWGAYTIQPTLDFLWAHEDQDAYTDSATVVHAANSISAGRVSLGPRILFPEMQTSNGYYRFWAAAMGEYDFSSETPVPASGLPDLGDVGSLRLSGGLTSRMGRGTFSLRGDVFGIGSGEFTAYGGTLGYELPF